MYPPYPLIVKRIILGNDLAHTLLDAGHVDREAPNHD